jgi:hypothetical protein
MANLENRHYEISGAEELKALLEFLIAQMDATGILP